MLKSLCGVLLASVLALALAPQADAKPRSVVLPGGQTSIFTLRGSDGYTLNVISEGREIEVDASHAKDGFASYSVPGHKQGKRGLEAKLPGIGRIAVEFHSTGKPKKIPAYEGCTGRPGRAETGIFVGTINFHGERDYTDVNATRAKGLILSTKPQTCTTEKRGGGGKGFDEMLGATLSATALKQGLVFTAGRIDAGEDTIASYTAAQVSRHRGMAITRAVSTGDLLGSFDAEHTGRTASAHVEPGAPFDGTADFGIEADGTVRWTGDLSVVFPGTEPIRLTGKQFLARLCVGRKCAGDAASSAAPTPRLWPK